MADELLDIVNEQDEIIGTMMRSEVYAKKLRTFRAINAFIINEKNQLWIPRRTATKALFPSCLDVSVGGHVQSGESYHQAFIREAAEEINVDLIHQSYRFLGPLSPFTSPVSAFMHVYEIPMNETPAYNREDFSESFWFTPAELLAKIANGEKAKSDLAPLVRIFYKELL